MNSTELPDTPQIMRLDGKLRKTVSLAEDGRLDITYAARNTPNQRVSAGYEPGNGLVTQTALYDLRQTDEPDFDKEVVVWRINNADDERLTVIDLEHTPRTESWIEQYNAKMLGAVPRQQILPPCTIKSEKEFYDFLPHYDTWEKYACGWMDSDDQRYNWVSKQDFNVDAPWWVKRERARILLPAYFNKHRALPKFLTDPPDSLKAAFEANDAIYTSLFPYMSNKNKGMLAFQEDKEDKQHSDRQLIIRPGRFLRRYYPTMTDDLVRVATANLYNDNKNTLQFAQTAEEFDDIYARGPSSCMSHCLDHFTESNQFYDLRPPAVMANGDIEVAYYELKNGHIPARSLVVQSTKEYVLIYHNEDAQIGAHSTLQLLLEAAGYKRNAEALIGQAINKVESDYGAIVCPYIDCNDYPVDVYADHLVIKEKDEGTHKSNYQTGILHEDPQPECSRCEASCNEDELTHTCEDGYVCESCLQDYFWSNTRNGNEEYVHVDNTVHCESNGDYYHTDYLSDNGIHYCDYTNEYWHIDDMVTVNENRLDGGTLVHCDEASWVEEEEDYYLNADVVTAHDGELIIRDNAHCIDGKYYRHTEVVMDEFSQPQIIQTSIPLSLPETEQRI